MTPTVYSWTFYEQHDLEGDGAAFGPLPGYIAVIKDVDAVLGGLSIGNVQLIGAAGQVIWVAQAISTAGAYFSWRGRYVLFPDTTAFVSTTVAMDVTVSGFMLLGPPPS